MPAHKRLIVPDGAAVYITVGGGEAARIVTEPGLAKVQDAVDVTISDVNDIANRIDERLTALETGAERRKLEGTANTAAAADLKVR